MSISQIVRRRMPPLNAMRAFEAAARQLSFARAADELAVTAGAISQHIKLLEDHAGGPLFLREGRGLRLTELDGSLYPVVSNSFARMEEAAELIYRPAPPMRFR